MKDPVIGSQLANFRIERLLGQGGTATVYFGQDVKLHRPVALKVLDKRYKNHPAYAKRFVNEARMMAKWRHENIIQIYYADDAQGVQYYAMEYVDGQDLSAVMESLHERGKLMPAAEVLRIGTAIASALDYAHRQGVIHRDVKPSNILLSHDERVLLGDFGMALEVRDGSVGTAFGTPHYISPEQARRSADAVPQSDLYSLAVILYEILTGAVPFNAPSPSSIALQHISQPPPSPRTLNPQLPVSVEAVLLKALAKDPKDRYSSGAKLMMALENALPAVTAMMDIPLPPLPVGVPTVRRDDIPEQYLQPKAATPAQLPPTIRVNTPVVEKKTRWWLFVLVALLAALAGFYYFNNPTLFAALPNNTATREATVQVTTSTPPHTPTDVPASPTQTSAPLEPLATQTELATKTVTLPAPPSATPEPFIFTPSIPIAPTVKYPDGYPFSLVYNESSFYLINRSIVRRSLSGFAFQRLDTDGLPVEDFFQGYLWEKSNNKNLLPKYCVNIIVYGIKDPPYLPVPAECQFDLVSSLQPRLDNPQGLIFWNAREDSNQFRVLWLTEEVARCRSEDGRCDFFLP
jgi:tRNA A-37 threonylcarbamoyl transferase component Bud32